MNRESESPLDLPSINRHAVIVRPTEVFIEWARVTPEEAPESMSEYLRQEGTVYLVPESATEDGPERYLRRHHDRIFQNELFACCIDPSTWPQKRTYAEFKKWFDVEIASMVMDLGADDIERD